MAKNENNSESSNSSETKIIVRFPDKLELAMVQANELKHYELFNWLIILLAPIASGFWIAYASGDGGKPLLFSAAIFTGITILFAILAFMYRKKVFHGSVTKSISLGDLK